MTLISGSTSFAVEVGEDGGKPWVQVSGKRLAFDLSGGTGDHPGGLWSVVVEGRQYEVQARVHDENITVEVDGERYSFARQDVLPTATSARLQEGSAEVVAPMPGKVVKLLATQGAEVQANQGILLFEAMKMQNEIRSPMPGTLQALLVREGQAVESRDRLFIVKASSTSS